LQDLRADFRVALHDFPFVGRQRARRFEDGAGYAYLAGVVQRRGQFQLLDSFARPA
jgi:hypothetical protein